MASRHVSTTAGSPTCFQGDGRRPLPGWPQRRPPRRCGRRAVRTPACRKKYAATCGLGGLGSELRRWTSRRSAGGTAGKEGQRLPGRREPAHPEPGPGNYSGRPSLSAVGHVAPPSAPWSCRRLTPWRGYGSAHQRHCHGSSTPAHTEGRDREEFGAWPTVGTIPGVG